MTLDQLVEAVKLYWADKSRTPEETAEGLRSLSDEIEILIDSLIP